MSTFAMVLICAFVQTSVGPDNIARYNAVQRLPRYLVSLVSESSLTSEQVDTVVDFWQQLTPFDQRRVPYQQRHRTKLPRGRFGRTKTTVSCPDSAGRAAASCSRQTRRTVFHQTLPDKQRSHSDGDLQLVQEVVNCFQSHCKLLQLQLP